MRVFLVPAVILLALGVALGADDVLQLKNGKLVTGHIVNTDQSGVTIETAKGRARFDWTSLKPRCEVDVRSRELAADDAEGHVKLAALCIRYGLYPLARREIATARSLSYPDKKVLDHLTTVADQAEADKAFAAVDQLMKQEEYEKALSVVRNFLRDAPPDSHFVVKAKSLATDLLRRIDDQRRTEREEEKATRAAEKKKTLAKRIAGLQSEVEKDRKAAQKAYTEAIRQHELGNHTLTRKNYEKAEADLLAAYKTLRRIQRMVPRGPAFDKAQDEVKAVRKKVVRVYLGLARMYVDDRNYRKGTLYVNEALYLDPVNKEALALRKEIDKNRIHLSARQITNTPGVRVTSGGN